MSKNALISNEGQPRMETLHLIIYHTVGVFLIGTMIKEFSEDKIALTSNEIDSVHPVLDTSVVDVDREDFPVGSRDDLTREKSVIGDGHGVHFEEISTVESPSSSNLGRKLSLSKVSHTISNLTGMSKMYVMGSDSETTAKQGAVRFEILQAVPSMEI